tara:strand:+ start:235 stop:390 length:156 start_codon:yes stop_codon:yes gene_type:complete
MVSNSDRKMEDKVLKRMLSTPPKKNESEAQAKKRRIVGKGGASPKADPAKG